MSTVTITETLKDQEGNNLVGYLKISNPAFLSPEGTALAISDATNATPIVITAATNAYTNGDTVYITGVGGNTAANGTWTIAARTSTTFELVSSIGNGTYSSGGTSQKLLPIGARTRRYPSSGTFNGTVTISLVPSTTGIAIPSGGATGFTYLVQYILNDGSQYYEFWNPAATPSSQTVTGIRTPGVLSPTATVALSQLAQTGATDTRNDYIFWNGTQWTRGLVNIAPNAQTSTTYTVLDTDRNKLTTFTNASAIAVTLPQAGGSSAFVSGWYAWFSNIGLGLVTITPTTSTINGVATLKLRIGQSVLIVSDGTNYFTANASGQTSGANPVNNTRSIFTSTAHRTQATTASEVTIVGTGVGSLTLPANFHDAAGSSLYVESQGYYSNTGTPTITFRIKYGATVLGATAAVTTTTGATNWQWFFKGLITCRTQGSSGTVMVQGQLILQTGAAAGGNCAVYPMLATVAVTVNTTATQAVDLTIQWGTSDAANTISGTNFEMHPIATPLT